MSDSLCFLHRPKRTGGACVKHVQSRDDSTSWLPEAPQGCSVHPGEHVIRCPPAATEVRLACSLLTPLSSHSELSSSHSFASTLAKRWSGLISSPGCRPSAIPAVTSFLRPDSRVSTPAVPFPGLAVLMPTHSVSLGYRVSVLPGPC